VTENTQVRSWRQIELVTTWNLHELYSQRLRDTGSSVVPKPFIKRGVDKKVPVADSKTPIVTTLAKAANGTNGINDEKKCETKESKDDGVKDPLAGSALMKAKKTT
jgi:hypothetical protein